MPCIGLGTWQVPDDDVLVKAIHSAVNLGYRHIDTAHIYGNERSVGVAVRTCGVPRSKLFVTSKLWNTDRGYKETLEAFERTMDALQIGYLDLFLMHWPAARGEAMTWQSINSGTWRAMEEIYRRGRVRAIGVSNFLVHHLVPLLARAEVVPMVNQIEFHPGYMQKATFDFCRSHGIQVEAWSPLGRGALIHHPVLVELAQQHGVTTAQIALRWCLQHGVAAVPKSLNPERQKQNAELFSFNLTPEEIERLDNLPQACFSGLDPDHVTF
ncbi:aldo/keto reductase [uncultured Duodenibacillus sp.]|uniref:aldo/keto reductase n=1 Tax=uncultured Duodenibacillus sp. TaxID=1980699 RepID=UPI0025880F9C|nr:aldo/keto reductase [uncultured Duodenibacillus sp.]